MEAHRHAFEKQGLNAIWPRIIGPGPNPASNPITPTLIHDQPAKPGALARWSKTTKR
ncbi:hypothetical protein ACNKHS_18815 [Shigella flexneri]